MQCHFIYDNNIKQCTISLSTSITMTEDNDELCIVAIVLSISVAASTSIATPETTIPPTHGSHGKQSTANFFVLVCAIFVVSGYNL